jgi:ubiquinone/menaquinone biosynthesis C-methylase UbiE
MKNPDKNVIDERFYNKYYDEQTRSLEPEIDYSLTPRTSLRRYRIQKVLQIYTPKKDETVLDIGCGWGTFCFAIAPLCKEITGLDFSKKSIALCKKLLKKHKYKNVKFVYADAQNTGLKSESFDVIVSAEFFEHLYPKTFEKVLDECRRLLKRGGKLIIWTPHGGHIFEILKNNDLFIKTSAYVPLMKLLHLPRAEFEKNISHVNYKSMDYLIHELKKRNFSIKKNYYVESHFHLFNTLEKFLLPFLPLMRRRIAILAEKTD